MFDTAALYTPITALPYRSPVLYQEFPAREALRPFLRCFWRMRLDPAARVNSTVHHQIVIPDTCADIILPLRNGKLCDKPVFAGVCLKPFLDESHYERDGQEDYAVRFYAWTLRFFTDFPLRDTRDALLDPQAVFPTITTDLYPALDACQTTAQRQIAIENWLLTLLNPARMSDAVLQAVQALLRDPSGIDLPQMAAAAHFSPRQLERLFLTHIGLTPVQLKNLVRYQSLWRECIAHAKPDFTDLAFRYGYADQSHLLREFKRFHSLPPKKARAQVVPAQTQQNTDE